MHFILPGKQIVSRLEKMQQINPTTQRLRGDSTIQHPQNESLHDAGCFGCCDAVTPGHPVRLEGGIPLGNLLWRDVC